MWKWIGISLAIAALLVIAVLIYLKTKKRIRSLSVDEIVGERCKVVETVDNYAGCGLVKVKGQIWSARGVDDEDIFEVGESLRVVAIEGVKLICVKSR